MQTSDSHTSMTSSSSPQPLVDPTRDGHVHTYLCRHAVGSMEEYVQAAIGKGLQAMTFLEHMEADIRYPHRSWLEEVDFDCYFSEGKRLRELYGEKIEVRLGVEMGYNPDAQDALRKKLGQYTWDSIGLSCHFYRHGERHYNLLSNRKESLDLFARIGVDTVLGTYFSMLTEAVQKLDCTVLCHLDAGLRHMPAIQFNDRHRQQIHSLLEAVHSRGMALEVNTSGFDYRGNPFPADWIIRTALHMEIPLSPGSDAHRPEDVGRHFDRLPAYLQALQQ